MSHDEVTFYLTTVSSVAGLFGLMWKFAVGDPMKRMRDDMVTKLQLEREFGKLREFLRKEYQAKH